MNDFPHRPLSPAGTMRRRELLARAAQMGIALPALGALGAACGSGSSSSSSPPSSSGPPTGTAVLLNYQGWMGKHTVADFETAYPGADIKQASLGSISSGAVVPQIKANMSTYDAALGDQAVTGQGMAADIIQQLDWSKIPNIKNVDAEVPRRPTRTASPPTTARPASATAPTWSASPSPAGPTSGTWPPSTRARSCSSTSTATASAPPSSTRASRSTRPTRPAGPGAAGTDRHQAAPAGAQVVQHRPGPGQGLLRDRDGLGLRRRPRPAGQPQHQVGAARGGRARVPGGILRRQGHAPDSRWCRRSSTSSSSPSSTPTSSTPPAPPTSSNAATPYINKTISENPALIVDPATLANVEFENYLGEATAAYNKLWDEFKSA